MARRLNHKREKMSDSTEKYIKNFLNNKNTPPTFGEINEYLKEHNVQYKNSTKDRSGLAHALNRMIKAKEIKKFSKGEYKNFPTYAPFDKSSFEAMLEGYLMRTESTAYLYKPYGFQRGEQDVEDILTKKKQFNFRELTLQKLITYLGIQIIYSVITSYERPINRTSKKIDKENHNVWLKNALSFYDPLDPIGEMVGRYLSGENIKYWKDSLKKIYPNISQIMEETFL